MEYLILEEIKWLPESIQIEVLHYIQYLRSKYQEEASPVKQPAFIDSKGNQMTEVSEHPQYAGYQLNATQLENARKKLEMLFPPCPRPVAAETTYRREEIYED